MAHSHEQLSNSPLVEVILELRGVTSKPPYSLIPGEMLVSLKTLYPAVTETEAAKVAALINNPPKGGLVVTHKYQALDGKGLIQLGPNGISIHSLAYHGFDEFKERIEAVLESYFRTTEAETIGRRGLRYVNLIRPSGLDLNGLSMSFKWPQIEGGAMGNIATRAVYSFEEPPGALGMVVASQPSNEGIVLDLDYYSEASVKADLKDTLDWTEKAHKRIYSTFRASVTEERYLSWK